MEIIPNRINMNQISLGTQSEKIQTSKTNIERLHEELTEETFKLCSGMSGEIKRHYVSAEECTDSSIKKVNDSLVKLADVVTGFSDAIKTLDGEAKYMAGGSANE